jgi:hypothetical protein
MVNGIPTTPQSLVTIIIALLVISIVALIIYFLRSYNRFEEWERRILAVILFFAIHELSVFIGDAFITQLTRILFNITLLYTLLYVIIFERKIKNIEADRNEFLKSLDEIKNIKEIREKLVKKKS